MTEPTRDALRAETLAYLEFQAADKLRVDANRTAMGMVPTDAWRKDAAMYAHAAACVREVAALRARPALPADLQAVVERLRGHLVRLDDGDYTDMPDVVQDVSALLAHIQRQDNS